MDRSLLRIVYAQDKILQALEDSYDRHESGLETKKETLKRATEESLAYSVTYIKSLLVPPNNRDRQSIALVSLMKNFAKRLPLAHSYIRGTEVIHI